MRSISCLLYNVTMTFNIGSNTCTRDETGYPKSVSWTGDMKLTGAIYTLGSRLTASFIFITSSRFQPTFVDEKLCVINLIFSCFFPFLSVVTTSCFLSFHSCDIFDSEAVHPMLHKSYLHRLLPVSNF